MTALREIFAEFGIKFDNTELDRADGSIKGVIDDLKNLGSAATQQEQSIEGIGNASTNVLNGIKGLATALAGAFTVGAIKQSLQELTHQADELEKAALALGTSVEQLAQYRHAAGLANVSAEQLRGAFAKLQRAAADAADGSGASGASFKKLGVSVKDAQGNLKPAGELLDEVADKLGAVENATDRNAIAMDLFGRTGFMLLPLFSEGADGIKKMRKEVEEFGGGITTDFAAKAALMVDWQQRQELALTSLRVVLGNEVLPLWTEFIAWTAKSTAAFVKWVRGTKLVTAALVAFGIKGLSMLVRALPVAIKLLGGMGAVLVKLRNFALRALIPFLAIEDFIVFLAGGDSLIGDGIEKAFGIGKAEEFRKFLLDLPKAIGELIAKLRELAAENGQTAAGMSDKFKTAAQDIKFAFGELWTWIQNGADLAVAHIRDALSDMLNWLFDKIGEFAGFAAKVAGMAPKWLVGSTGEDWAKSLSAVADSLDSSPEAQARRALAPTAVDEAEERVAQRERDRSPARDEARQRLRDFLGRDQNRKLAGQELRDLREAAELYEDTAGMQSIAPSVATEPAQSTTINQDVNQTNTINNNISVAPGTPEDQARDMANGVGKSTRGALSDGVATLRDQLVHTPG